MPSTTQPGTSGGTPGTAQPSTVAPGTAQPGTSGNPGSQP
jgi:hypothetical protein